MDRRTFLKYSAASAALLSPYSSATAAPWSGGRIRHLLPHASADSFSIKCSFSSPQNNLALQIGSKSFRGRATDSDSRFWEFSASGLEANHEYDLRIVGGRRAVSEPWPLRTMPSFSGPGSNTEHARILIYTCAGGSDTAEGLFHPISVRRRLLQRALSYKPNLAIGVGDQVYWDQTVTGARLEGRQSLDAKWGRLNPDLPILGSRNEDALTRSLDEQIAMLYQTDFRSIPTILTQDDHDYFENDDANDKFIAFPPRHFIKQLADTSQRLYYPDHMTDAMQGPTLPKGYGTIRWGKLLEMLLYDCRRFLNLKGPSAVFVEESAERWLARRTADEDAARHLIHVPSTPMGWSAGKWGEWYPDRLEEGGTLGTTHAKPYWQQGWFNQHQRILNMLAAQETRIPLMLSGDLHAIASGAIMRSGNETLKQPVHSVLAGPISSDGWSWPSAFRGTGPLVPSQLEVEERTRPLEHNGFTILDVDTSGITVKQFAWHKSMGLAAIDSLQPLEEFRLDTPATNRKQPAPKHPLGDALLSRA